MSSRLWWVAPYIEAPNPACAPIIFMGTSFRAAVTFICSNVLPGEKTA
ncbi:MAG: hypothetical protein ACD_13C00229G0003 [uncultured bacterium]|nr:MAG: hypothetical protein ACD_13C00229G0003 [uncultured bacterium]